MDSMMTGSSKTMRAIAIGLLTMAVCGAALAFGGVIREAIVGVAVLAVLALLSASWKARQLSLEPLGALLLLGTVATWFQLLPLPVGLVSSLAPHTAAIHLGAAEALGQTAPGSVPLSIDPQATRLMAIWWLAVTAVYMTCRRLARRENQVQQLILGVPVLGVVIVLVGLVHAVLGADAIYGTFQPSAEMKSQTGALYVSTFLNPNHLAAFLNLGAPIALAYASSERLTQRTQILWLCIFVVLAIGMAMTASRAGILTGGFVAGLILLTGDETSRRKYAILVATGIIGFLALVSPLGTELATLAGVGELVGSTDRGMHQLGMAVTGAWPWTGAGRGAFPVAYTAVNDGLATLTVTHAHNSILQLLADYGLIIGGVLAVGGVALMVGPLRRAVATPMTRGAAAGLLAVFLHNLVDFNLDILGVAVVFAGICGVLRVSNRGIHLRWQVVSGGAAAALVLIVVSTSGLGLEPGPRRNHWILGNPVQAAERHPGDAYAFLGAGLAKADMELLKHSARLNPHEPRVHLAMAAVGEKGERLGLIRQALALPTSYRIRHQTFALLRREANTGAKVMEGLGPNGDTVASYIAWDRPAKEPVLRRAFEQFPDHVGVMKAIAAVRLAQSNIAAVDDLATRLMIAEEPEGYRLKGLVLARRERHLDAYYMYREAGDPDSLLDAAEQALAAGEPERARKVLATAQVGARHLKRLRALKRAAAKQSKLR